MVGVNVIHHELVFQLYKNLFCKDSTFIKDQFTKVQVSEVTKLGTVNT